KAEAAQEIDRQRLSRRVHFEGAVALGIKRCIVTETAIHDVHKPSSSARLIAALRWFVPSRYARRLIRSPPASPVAKSAQRPDLRLTLNDPSVRSGRVGLRANHSLPMRLPSGNQRGSRTREF